MSGCSLFKCRIILFSRTVCLVGDSPYDYKGNLVKVCSVCDRRTFHLGTVGFKILYYPVLYLGTGYELVTAGNSADAVVEVGLGLFDGLLRSFNKMGICGKLPDAELGNLSYLVRKNSDIDIVMNGILRNKYIADVQIVVERSRNTCIDDMGGGALS